MNKFKAPLSFKIIFILNEIIFWLFNLVSVLAVVLIILILTGVFKEDLQLHVGLPVAFDAEEIGFLMANNTPVNVQLVEAYGDIHLIDTPQNLSKLFTIPLLIVVGVIYFLIYTFRKFIRNVRRGIIFEINNIKLLRVLSLGLLGFWLFWKFYDWFVGMMMVKRLHFGTIELSNETQGHMVLLLSSLVLWVLSHIFIQGMKLHEENSLTI